MPLWLFRWLFFAAASVNWAYSPRNCFTMLVIADILFITLTIFSMKGLKGKLGILMLIQEVFLLIWHISSLVLFIDYFSLDPPGTGKMSDKATGFWVWVIIIAISCAIIIEFFILFSSMFYKHKKKTRETVNLGSDEVSFGDSERVSELDNKIRTYNGIKSGGTNNEGKLSVTGKYGVENVNVERPAVVDGDW